MARFHGEVDEDASVGYCEDCGAMLIGSELDEGVCEECSWALAEDDEDEDESEATDG